MALSYPQMMHAAVLDSFPPALGGAATETGRRVLWRVDRYPERVWLYVLSPDKPDFSHIVEQFGWPSAGQEWETKNYDALLGALEAGQRRMFRLHANPVYTTDGSIRSHVTVEQQKRWLCDRAAKNGFSIAETSYGETSCPEVDVVYRNTLKFKKKAMDNKIITLSVATFEGALRVEDAELLKRALCLGVGRAKAYGCGLMTLTGAI